MTINVVFHKRVSILYELVLLYPNTYLQNNRFAEKTAI